MASLQVDAAPVEEVKIQAEPTTNVPSNVKETEVHEQDESTETLVPYVEDEETLKINSDEEEEEREMESLVKKDDDYSPVSSVEQPAWAAEFDEEEEDEEEEEDGSIHKF
ncbi:unnamed protein product [Fraxinus pennsylvanica]|uniref:Uncharacterized protein n=1 Tax=Fraxinus pennsylvanica TaxID=56036 RepID=A0AAD2E8H7_9LAMI|nr:unnamed protein product [Fraxinus pennsylvanica]